jgi:hypothetical protein
MMLSTLPYLIGKRPRPARVHTDEVFPTHFLDDTPGNRSFVLVWTLRFNDVLDADMLHSSLSRLLEKEGWRKMGGRLRMNVSSPKRILQIELYTNGYDVISQRESS